MFRNSPECREPSKDPRRRAFVLPIAPSADEDHPSELCTGPPERARAEKASILSRSLCCRRESENTPFAGVQRFARNLANILEKQSASRPRTQARGRREGRTASKEKKGKFQPRDWLW